MRPISVIKQELYEAEQEWLKRRSALHNEIAEFQEKCPHTRDFLKVEKRDTWDDEYGAGRYDYTTMIVTCLLCEKVAYSEDYKKGSFLQPRNEPDPSEVIHKD